MRELRIFFLLVIGIWIVLTLALPAFMDSERMKVAFRHYHEVQTDATRRELAEAHRLDRRDSYIISFVVATILSGVIYGVVRLGRRPSQGGAAAPPYQ